MGRWWLLSQIRLGGVAAAILVSLSAAKQAAAQTNGCVPALLQLAHGTDVIDYQRRPANQPNRCEGVYDPQKSTPAVLELMGYTTVLEAFDPASDEKLQLRWTAPPGGSNFRLRCYQLFRGAQQIYQMDSAPDLPNLRFDWPLEIVRRIGLGREDLGLVSWATYRTTRGLNDVYLPLEAVRSKQPGGAVRSPQMVIMVNQALRRLTLKVEAVNADLTPVAVLRSGEVKDVSLSANSPLYLDGKHLGFTIAGFYAVTIGADPVDAPNFPLPVFVYYVP